MVEEVVQVEVLAMGPLSQGSGLLGGGGEDKGFGFGTGCDGAEWSEQPRL